MQTIVDQIKATEEHKHRLQADLQALDDVARLVRSTPMRSTSGSPRQRAT